MIQTLVSQASRQALTDNVIEAKARKGLSWQDLTDDTGLSLVFVTAALLGQHPLPTQAAEVVCKKLDLGSDAVALLERIPLRGSIPGGLPTDPTVYRF